VEVSDDISWGASGLTADKKNSTASLPAAGGTRPRKSSRATDPHVADALRTAYQEAVGEDVPQEFLDLLGKLA
jgi:hypothetical protein